MTMGESNLVDELQGESVSEVLILGTGERAAYLAKRFSQQFKCRTIILSRQLGAEFSADDDREFESATTPELTATFLKNLLGRDDLRGSLLVSIGSPWIVKPEILDLFEGWAINFHPGSLPGNRGASAISWAVMNREPSPSYSLHILDTRIDGGSLILSEKFFAMDKLATVLEVNELQQSVLEKLLDRFFSLLQSGKPLDLEHQSGQQRSHYFPALSAEHNGWINWDWSGAEILSFIKAFSLPYSGASTLHNGRRLRVLNADFVGTEGTLHPFARGVIVGKIHDVCRVAVDGGEIILRQGDIEVAPAPGLREGDRLYTPHAYLDGAKAFRRRNL